MGLTLELDGSISPHAWMSLTPAVWELSTMGRRVTACCSIQARRTRDRGKFTVVPSRSWGSTIVGVALAHLAGLLETVRLGLEGLYLPFGGPERLAVRVGQSIDCLGHARLCVELGSEWQVLH